MSRVSSASVAGMVAFMAAWSAPADEESVCLCGPFDKPSVVVREASIDFDTARRVAGTEIYMANTSLSAGSAEAPFVVVGGAGEAVGRVRFRARTEITLGAGFHAERGSHFEASLVPLTRVRERRSVWPEDTEAANANPKATRTVIEPTAAPEPPDPYAIAPMKPPRRPIEGGRS